MDIGFTGTRDGMTVKQVQGFNSLLSSEFFDKEIKSFAHGDSVGADSQAHDLMDGVARLIVIHPPTDSKLRAFHKLEDSDKSKIIIYPPRDYLQRNHNIVDACDVLIATPKEEKEKLRSGTWATVRYAKKSGKRVIIIYPNGEIEENN